MKSTDLKKNSQFEMRKEIFLIKFVKFYFLGRTSVEFKKTISSTSNAFG